MKYTYWLALIAGILAWTGPGCMDSPGSGEAAIAGPASPRIHLNQVGYYPKGPKRASVQTDSAGTFSIRSLDGKRVLFEGRLSAPQVWPYSQQAVATADFSEFSDTGRFVLLVPGTGYSVPFRVQADLYRTALRKTLLAFTRQRCSQALDGTHHPWARPAGHPDTSVRVHPSAASAGRPAGSLVRAPGGWYDAGDYGKYVPTATYSTWMLLSLYEQGKGLPAGFRQALLAEALYSLRWLLAMQDPQSGVVAHKLTTAQHAPKVMPHQDRAERLLIGQGTAATWGLTAVAAQAARLLRKARPALADSCLQAAKLAWQWGLVHPQVAFTNPPGIHTGPCKDFTFTDERAWAGVELYLATADEAYLRQSRWQETGVYTPSRRHTGPLAWLSLGQQHPAARQRVLALADTLLGRAQRDPAYGVPMQTGDFLWGSNGILASKGAVLMAAYQLSGEARYREGALAVLDYLLGRNALGMSFVTGLGQRSPRQPHHRPAAADGVEAPLPGWLVGGPHGEAFDDGVAYADSLPGTHYRDDWRSYTTNEGAINWNAPWLYLLGMVEATR